MDGVTDARVEALRDHVDNALAAAAAARAALRDYVEQNDRRVTELMAARARALDDALAAARDARDKADEANARHIEALRAILDASVAGLNSKIDDLKAELAAIDRRAGVSSGRVGGLDLAWARTLSAVAILVAIAAVLVTIIITRQ